MRHDAADRSPLLRVLTERGALATPITGDNQEFAALFDGEGVGGDEACAGSDLHRSHPLSAAALDRQIIEREARTVAIRAHRDHITLRQSEGGTDHRVGAD